MPFKIKDILKLYEIWFDKKSADTIFPYSSKNNKRNIHRSFPWNNIKKQANVKKTIYQKMLKFKEKFVIYKASIKVLKVCM